MLAVTHSLTLGSLRYDSHLAALTVRRGVLPIVDRLDASLPRGVRVDAAAGDPVELTLDGGDGSEVVFTGTVTSVRRDLATIVVVAHGAGHTLARYRPSVSLEQVTAGDVVTQLCGDAGVSVAEVESGPTLARYVALARATALEEVVRLTHLSAATATVTATDELRTSTEPAAERRLRWGREPLTVTVAGAAAATGAFVVAGEGAGEPGASNGLWPTDDFWAGGAPAPGPQARWRVDHDVRSTSDATTAGDAWAARDAEARTPVRLRSWLLPALGPDDSVEIAEGPDDLGLAAIRVRQVVHRLQPGRPAVTDIWGHAAGAGAAGGAGGLLGALASAVGSLL